MKKVILLFFLLVSVIPKLYSQQKPHTIFNKDSLISLTNYISKFKTIDSMVVKTEKKTIVIS